jgi:hypothetical protein
MQGRSPIDEQGRRGSCRLLRTHIALALSLAACQRGHRVHFTTAAALVSELIEARDEKKLLRFQKQIASYELLIVDERRFENELIRWFPVGRSRLRCKKAEISSTSPRCLGV